MISRIRAWRRRVRIAKILDEAGWPSSAQSIFSGDVRVFASYYVDNYKDPIA